MEMNPHSGHPQSGFFFSRRVMESTLTLQLVHRWGSEGNKTRGKEGRTGWVCSKFPIKDGLDGR